MWYPFFKRCLDVIVAAVLLVVFFPVMVLCAIAVWIDSPGPIIFRQQRVGRGGGPFTIYKFRTMENVSDLSDVYYTDEELVTAVGRWLRPTRLDELPQLINVLIGQMSMVGPRPLPFCDSALSKTQLYKHRHSVKPGITGWYKVLRLNHPCNAEMLLYDVGYVYLNTFWLDCYILFRTFDAIIRACWAARRDKVLIETAPALPLTSILSSDEASTI